MLDVLSALEANCCLVLKSTNDAKGQEKSKILVSECIFLQRRRPLDKMPAVHVRSFNIQQLRRKLIAMMHSSIFHEEQLRYTSRVLTEADTDSRNPITKPYSLRSTSKRISTRRCPLSLCRPNWPSHQQLHSSEWRHRHPRLALWPGKSPDLNSIGNVWPVLQESSAPFG